MIQESFYSVGRATIRLKVRARPHSRTEAVLGVRAGELTVAVSAPPEKGKANAAVARVLARALGVPRDSVALKSGGSSPHKVFEVPLEAAAALKGLEGSAPSP